MSVVDAIDFCTRSPGHRTRLTAGLVLLQRTTTPESACKRAQKYSNLTNRVQAAVAGKIAVVDVPSGRISVFQRLPTSDLKRCWCGNATFAALEIAHLDRAIVVGPQHREIFAERRGHRLGFVVPGEPEPPLSLHWSRKTTFVLRNFNTYFAVVGGPNDLPPEVMGANAKALVVDASEAVPVVRVRIAAGWHGAVPLTAGAELVLAASEMGLAQMLGDSPFIRTAGGEIEELPTCHAGLDWFDLTFAERYVDFAPLISVSHGS